MLQLACFGFPLESEFLLPENQVRHNIKKQD